MRWFTHRVCLLAFVALSFVSAFSTACPLGPPCLDLNTQIKGSRLPSWGTDSGIANAYAITTIGDIGSGGVLQTGSRFMFIATHTNTTASTLAVDGGSAIAIKKSVSSALTAGDIVLNQVTEVTYDGTNFQLVGNGVVAFSSLSGSLACSQMPALTGDVTSSSGTCATALITKLRTHTCEVLVGANNGSAALVSADIGPQNDQCQVHDASTLQEISLTVDNASSTTSIQVRKRHCSTFTSGSCTAFTTTNLLSAVLSAASTAEAIACAMSTTSATCDDGTTSSGTVTVSTTAVAAGDWLELTSGTADGTTKRATITFHFTTN